VAALILSAIVAAGLAVSACREPEPSWVATERAFWMYKTEHYRAVDGPTATDAEIAAKLDDDRAALAAELDGRTDAEIATF